MNQKSLAFVSAIVTLLLFCFCKDAAAFRDDFNDSTINPALWQILLPFGSSQVFETGGRAVLIGRGGLSTVGNFPTSVEILGRLRFTGVDDDFKVTIRSDLAFVDPTFKERQGIQVGLSQVNNEVFIQEARTGNNYVRLGTGSHVFTDNVDTDFRIVDDGSSISLYLNGAVNPALMVSSAFRAGDKCAFYNREFDSNRSELDFLDVHVPEVEILPAWTHVASSCVVDEDSVGKFEFANADFKFRGTNVSTVAAGTGALIPITARCNVINPFDERNPDWNRLIVGYQDSNGTNAQNGAVVRLKRVSRPSGTVFVEATFNSNDQSATNRTERSIPVNHEWDFLRNEYFVQIELTRGSAAQNVSVFSLRLVRSEPLP